MQKYDDFPNSTTNKSTTGKRNRSLSYKLFLARINPERPAEKVLAYLHEHGAKNSRQICRETGIERTSITGLLNRLIELGEIEISHTAACKITGRNVMFFQIRGRD